MNKSVPLGVAILLGAAFCSATQADDCAFPPGFVKGRLSGFAAGPGQQTLQQAYVPDLALPIDEEKLIALLKARHLKVDSDTEGRDVPCRDIPWWSKTIDFRLAKTYYITDPSKMIDGQEVHFSAFVSADGKVFYIENRFAPPLQ